MRSTGGWTLAGLLTSLLAAPIPALAVDGLVASPTILDFGDRGHGETPTLELTLRNEGTRPVRIEGLRPTCSCLSSSPARVEGILEPGAERRVRVSMASGRAMGSLSKAIEVLTSSGGVLRVPTRMRVFDGFRLEPLDLAFTGVVGGAPVTQTVEVRWTRRTPPPDDLELDVLEYLEWSDEARGRVVSPHFRHRVEPIPGGARLHLTLLPTHPEGRINLHVRGRFRGKSLDIYARGEVFDGIVVDPTHFGFSRVEWWQPEASFFREVSLRSADGAPFRVTGVKVEVRTSQTPGLELEVRALPSQDRRSWVLRGRLRVPAASVPQGSFAGKVWVETDHPRKPRIELGLFGLLATPR